MRTETVAQIRAVVTFLALIGLLIVLAILSVSFAPAQNWITR